MVALNDELLTAEDVAGAMKVTPKTVRTWVKSIAGFPAPVIQRHKFTRWSRVEVEKYVGSLVNGEREEARS